MRSWRSMTKWLLSVIMRMLNLSTLETDRVKCVEVREAMSNQACRMSTLTIVGIGERTWSIEPSSIVDITFERGSSRKQQANASLMFLGTPVVRKGVEGFRRWMSCHTDYTCGSHRLTRWCVGELRYVKIDRSFTREVKPGDTTTPQIFDYLLKDEQTGGLPRMRSEADQSTTYGSGKIRMILEVFVACRGCSNYPHTRSWRVNLLVGNALNINAHHLVMSFACQWSSHH
ncbi:hypothetical protein BJ546DRAFT_207482 [Cryomyces antarcticus]